MKWSALSPQKKLYCSCGLIFVVVIILIVDHIKLRQETSRLKRAIIVSVGMSRRSPVGANDLEWNVNRLKSQMSDIEYRVDELESKANGKAEQVRVNSLESEISSCNSKISDLEDTLQSELRTVEWELEKRDKNSVRNRDNISVLFKKLGLQEPLFQRWE